MPLTGTVRRLLHRMLEVNEFVVSQTPEILTVLGASEKGKQTLTGGEEQHRLGPG